MAIGDVAGSVSFIFGTVVAVSANGIERVLSLGDPLYEGDQIRVADGGRIEIAAANGEILALGSGQEATVDATFLSPSGTDGQSQNQDIAATVTSISGTVVAVAPDGSERILAVGDVLFEGELIRVASGGSVQLTGASGETVFLASGQQALITPEFYTDAAQFDSSQSVASSRSAGQALQQTGEIDAIQAAILAGEDPTAVAEATAAGQAPGEAGGPGDSGSSFVLLSRTGQEVNPEAGYPTSGLSRGFTTPDNDDVLLTEAEPVVSVIFPPPEKPIDGEPPVEPNPDFPIVVSGQFASVLEGTNGGQTRLVTFLLTLDRVFDQDVTVKYELRPGDLPNRADNPDDWFDGPLLGTTIIHAGELTAKVQVYIVMDHLHEGNETFLIELLSANGASINPNASKAIVTIIDDDTVPQANDDLNQVREDGFGDDEVISTSGNVIGGVAASAGDVADTDADGDIPQVIGIAFNGIQKAVGGDAAVSIDGLYGTLTIHSDGSYSYELTANNSVDIQSLSAGQSLSEVFTYTITDGYNPDFPSSAKLTIKILGANDGVTITGLGGEGAEQIVNEANLADGSNPNPAALTQAGSFSFEAKDGLATVQIGGEAGFTLSLAALKGLDGTQVVSTPYGTLTLDSYTGNDFGGSISYRYTLNDNVDNDSQAGDNNAGFTDRLAVKVTDADGSTQSASLDIRIVDDRPEVQPDSGDVTEGATLVVAAAAGVLANDTAGADGASLQGVRAANGDTTTAAVGNITSAVAGEFGTLTLYEDGRYIYKSTANAISDNKEDKFVYSVVDGDGDVQTTTLIIAITNNGITVRDDDTVTVNESALDMNKDGSDLAQGTVTGSLPGTTFETSTGTLTDNVTGGEGALKFTLVGSDAGKYGQIQINMDGTYTYTLTKPVTSSPAADDGSNLEDNADSFTYQVTDANGNSGQATIYININDDVPSVTAALADTGVELDETSAGEGFVSGPISATSVAAILSTTVLFGADGAAASSSVAYGLKLSGNGSTALVTANGDHAIILVETDASTITGKYNDGSLKTAFTVKINADGTLTVTQHVALEHNTDGSTPADHNDTLSLGGLIIATVKVTDADGDTDSASAEIGGAVTFYDDGPSVTAEPAGDADLLEVDESNLAANDSVNFADNFAAAINYGADGAGSVAYSLHLSAAGIGSGLYALDSSDTSVVDSDGYGQGAEILLTQLGNVITGSIGNTDYFTITMAADGTVIFDQKKAVWHSNTGDPDDVSTLTTVAASNLLIRATVTDADGDTATADVNLGAGVFSIKDDGPSIIAPDVTFLLNQVGQSGSFGLDIDRNIDDNYGADQGGTLRFAAVNGTDSGFTSGLQVIYLYTNGTTLIGSTFAGGTGVLDASVLANKAYTITLNPDGSLGAANDTYTFQMHMQIDGGVGTFNTNVGSWGFTGGNTNYAYFENSAPGSDLPNVLLTPTGSLGQRINGNANEAGASGGGGGQNVGSNEGVRVDFVENIAGSPVQKNYYANPIDHSFTNHVLVNGAEVSFGLSGQASATVSVRAFDDLDYGVTDEPDDVGDYTSDAITRVLVNGIAFTGTGTQGGFTVTFVTTGALSGTVTVAGITNNNSIVVFTDSGFTTVEYHYVSGNTFSLNGFGASTFDPGALVNMDFDLTLTDSDGDSVLIENGIRVQLSPDDHVIKTGGAGVDNLSADPGQATTLIGLAGNDILTGDTGDDIFVGGSGNDTMTGKGGADTYLWYAGDQGGVGVGNYAEDRITDFNTAQGDVLNLSDLLTGETEGTIDNFIFVHETGGNSVLYVSTGGGMAGAANAADAANVADQVIQLDGVTGINLATLISNGNLDVDN